MWAIGDPEEMDAHGGPKGPGARAWTELGEPTVLGWASESSKKNPSFPKG